MVVLTIPRLPSLQWLHSRSVVQPVRLGTRTLVTTRVTMARHADHYGSLKLPQNASKQQIKARFYELSKKYHPDASTGNTEKFHTISEAYAVLGDDSKRSLYDKAILPASQTAQYPHSHQSRGPNGPHRSWGRRPPPGAHWTGSRRVPPDLGSGMGMSGGPVGGQAAWGRRERRSGSAGLGRVDEEIQGESGLWRFGAVVFVLFGIVWFGGGLTASAEELENDDNDGDKEVHFYIGTCSDYRIKSSALGTIRATLPLAPERAGYVVSDRLDIGVETVGKRNV